MFPSNAPFESEQCAHSNRRAECGKPKHKGIYDVIGVWTPSDFHHERELNVDAFISNKMHFNYTRWRRQENGCGLSFDSRVRASSHARARVSCSTQTRWLGLGVLCLLHFNGETYIRNLCKMKRSSKYFNCIKGRKNMQMELNAKLFETSAYLVAASISLTSQSSSCDQISYTVINSPPQNSTGSIYVHLAANSDFDRQIGVAVGKLGKSVVVLSQEFHTT